MSSAPDTPDALVGLALAMQAAPGRFSLLLGSGLSNSAGIPTGWAVVSDLARRVAVASGESEELDDPISWYASRHGTPDYSGLLEGLAPTPAQRRDLLASYFEPDAPERESGKKVPTSAHRAIAKLVARGTVKVIITTNFDRLLEQALQAEGIEPIVVATPSAAQGTVPLAHSRCTVVKVHGDYLDPDIKNTAGELDAYEPALDALLDRIFDDYGTVICGWSATWDRALRCAIERCPTRRYGTYWAAHGPVSPEAERLIANRGAAVMPITDADTFFEALLGKIEALDDLRRQPGNADVLAAEVKRYLPDPVHRIRLHDTVMDATQRALASIDFDGNPSDPSGGAYLTKTAGIEKASADAVTSLSILAQFADRQDHTDLLRRSITALADPVTERLNGSVAWLNLRGYPALLALYGVGLCSVATERWDCLADVLAVQVRDPAWDDKLQSLPGSLRSWRVLDSQTINTKYSSPGRKTPVSDHLHEVFSEMIRPNLRLSPERFDDLFDQWEFLIGVVSHDGTGSGPIGRFVWRREYVFRGRPPDRAFSQATDALLRKGLFEANPDRLNQVRTEYDSMVSNSGLKY